MKVRTGFVSNSSSSSFCIFGAGGVSRRQIVVTDELVKILNKNGVKGTKEDFENDLDMSSCAEALGLDCYYIDGGDYYVGVSFMSIEDHETGKQFKERVQALLDLLFGGAVKGDNFLEEYAN